MDKELRKVAFFSKLMPASVFGFKLLYYLSKLLSGSKIKGVQCEQRWIASTNANQEIRLRIYKPLNQGKQKLPVMLYLHGGGYVLGVPEIAGARIKDFIKTRACVVVAPDYRKAFDAPYPAALHDAYDTLLWIKANASELNINADQT